MRRLLPLLASLVLLALPASAHAFTFTEWSTSALPGGITRLGDTLYFSAGAKLGQTTVRGVQTETAVVGATAIGTVAPGPGAGTDLWFVDNGAHKVGRMTAAGVTTLFTADYGSSGQLRDLAAGPDGNMWVVQATEGKAHCVNPSGVPTPHQLVGLFPTAIARGGDGAMWIVDSTANTIVRLVPGANCSMTKTEWPAGGLTGLTDIVPAATGNDLQMATSTGLVRVTPNGTEQPAFAAIPQTGRPFTVHATGSTIWWTDTINKRIGRLEGNVVMEWAIPRNASVPQEFAFGSDGALWYAGDQYAIGRFSEEVGPQGPQGPQGNPGTPGTPGAPGTPGSQGPQGNPGAQGEKGDQGASVLGSSGTMGPSGPAGARGATGATGATGPQGARGKTGPAAKLPKISCKLSGSKVTCKVAKSGGSGGSGGGEGNSGGGEGLRLRLSRAHKLYATGSRAATSTRTKVNLHAVRRLTAGKYTLVVSVGADVTIRVPVRLG